jgi:hypothetical protein
MQKGKPRKPKVDAYASMLSVLGIRESGGDAL